MDPSPNNPKPSDSGAADSAGQTSLTPTTKITAEEMPTTEIIATTDIDNQPATIATGSNTTEPPASSNKSSNKNAAVVEELSFQPATADKEPPATNPDTAAAESSTTKHNIPTTNIDSHTTTTKPPSSTDAGANETTDVEEAQSLTTKHTATTSKTSPTTTEMIATTTVVDTQTRTSKSPSSNDPSAIETAAGKAAAATIPATAAQTEHTANTTDINTLSTTTQPPAAGHDGDSYKPVTTTEIDTHITTSKPPSLTPDTAADNEIDDVLNKSDAMSPKPTEGEEFAAMLRERAAMHSATVGTPVAAATTSIPSTTSTDTTSRIINTSTPTIDEDNSFSKFSRASYLPIVNMEHLKPWNWVGNENDTFYSKGIHAAPLSAFEKLYDQVPTKLSHLMSRVYENQRPRFVVDFYNTSVIIPEIIDHNAIPSYARYKLGILQDLYKHIFIADGKMSGRSLHPRSENAIESIVQNRVTISIVISVMVGEKGIRKDEIQYNKCLIAAITFTSLDDESILISLCGTLDMKYDNQFGSGNDNQSFRRRGLMTILVRMACSLHLSMKKKFLSIFSLVYPDDPSRLLFWIQHRFALHSRSIFQSLAVLPNNVFTNWVLPPCVGDEFVYISSVGKFRISHSFEEIC